MDHIISEIRDKSNKKEKKKKIYFPIHYTFILISYFIFRRYKNRKIESSSRRTHPPFLAATGRKNGVDNARGLFMGSSGRSDIRWLFGLG